MANEPWRGRSVLIVDDSASVRQSLRHSFSALGMQVVGEVENGVQALRRMREKPADLVSLDFIMPEMDGVECYRHLRKEFPEARIIIISWLGDEAKIIDNLKEQIAPDLIQSKPVTPDILRSRLARIYGVNLGPAKTFDVPMPRQNDDDFDSLGVKVV